MKAIIKPLCLIILSAGFYLMMHYDFYPSFKGERLETRPLQKGEKLQYIHPEESLKTPSLLTQQISKLRNPPSFVASFKGASVYKTDGLILKDSTVFLEPLYQSNEHISQHEIFNKVFFPKKKSISGTLAVMASASHNGYYHWMMEVLPRLALIQASGFVYDSLYVPPLQYRYQKESLQLLAPHIPIIEASKHTHLQPDTLLFTSIPTYAGYNAKQKRLSRVPSWVPAFLKEQFLPLTATLHGPHADKIYISRQKASRRRLLNEEELIQALKQRGFVIYQLEDMGLLQQVQLFHQASCILTPHGAALSNLVFCKKDTVVVELFHPEYLSDCYQQLCQLLSFKHHYLVGEKVPKPLFSKDPKDYLLSLKQLLPLIDRL